MTTLRFPLAGVWGAVCTVALFALLAHMVNVRMDVAQAVEGTRFDFTRVRPETPTETKRREKPTRTAPPVTPGKHRIATRTDDPGPTILIRPAVEIRIPPDGGRRMGTDRDVQPIVRIEPDYPQALINRNVEGWVKVQFTVTATGAVRDAFVVDASPRTVFDTAALKAIARWRYNPRVENGMPVERVGMQTVIRFQLENTL